VSTLQDLDGVLASLDPSVRAIVAPNVEHALAVTQDGVVSAVSWLNTPSCLLQSQATMRSSCSPGGYSTKRYTPRRTRMKRPEWRWWSSRGRE
jgi:hypothetical protein